MNRRLSVILPCYNHARLLPRALAALAAQRRPADEILLLDDASTDDGLAVAASWQERLPQLQILPQPRNAGVIEMLQLGLAAATGEYVYMGASDDEAMPALFERAVTALEAHPGAALAAGEVLLVGPDGRSLGLRPVILPRRTETFVDAGSTTALLRGADNLFVGVGTVWRRAAMVAAGDIDPTLGSMVDGFLARELALRHGFVFIPEVLGVWHVNPGGFSRTAARDTQATLAMIDKARTKMEQSIGVPYPAWYPALFERRSRFAVARLLVLEPASKRPDPAQVLAMAGGGILDRAALLLAGQLPGWLGRILALGWLTLRLRPMSLTAILASRIDRWRHPRR
jgi:hypothetical protein